MSDDKDGIRQHTPRYIADMTKELAYMASRMRYPELAYLLRIAQLEADQIDRRGGEPEARPPTLAPH